MFLGSANATVFEFDNNGSVTKHEAYDYLSKSRRKTIKTSPIFISKRKGDFDKYVNQSAQKYNISAKLIHAVIQTESSYNPTVTSHAGAEGLMQLMPFTAKRFGVQDSFDPKQNIDGGSQYLKFLLDRYNGDKELALAAYNAGEGAVDKYSGVPPYQETIGYIRKIKKLLGQSF